MSMLGVPSGRLPTAISGWVGRPGITTSKRRCSSPIVPSPSGLPSQHLVTARDGAEHLFVGQQWLQPGERVLLHTHPVEEVLTFLSGSGEATLGDETVSISPGTSLYVPPSEVHGFRCTEGTLHVFIVFPVPHFAETTMVEELQP